MPDALTEGWRALAEARFDDAVALFEGAEGAEALDGAGLARWFRGELEEGLALREAAFAAYAATGDASRAARVGVWVSRQYLISGRSSASAGWLTRAERVLAEAPEDNGHGWVEVELARRAATVAESSERAARALQLARDHRDPDLEVFALSVLGRAEVAAGDAELGFRDLEEAMAAASAGVVRNLHTLGEAYCNLIIACAAAADLERASEWCRHVDAFAEERGIVVLTGACRTVHADVLVASGRWDEAESALADALDAHRRRYPAMATATVATLALLRVRQGRLAEAEELLSGREEQPLALQALAELRLAEGEPRTAAALLERALAGARGDMLTEARLLSPLVDAHLAASDHERALAAAERLRALARGTSRLVGAYAALASARLALATGDELGGREQAMRSLEAFGALAMPHEAAAARLELARSLVAELPELAREEAQAAWGVYKELGARSGMDAAALVLRRLGRRPAGDLTPRESEVLELVARGLTNAAIAQTLFISEKTAGHHVSRILSKLGARNRAEAAVRAAQLRE